MTWSVMIERGHGLVCIYGREVMAWSVVVERGHDLVCRDGQG